jgi:hypothetical protein
VPLKPLDAVTDIVLIPLAPCATVTLLGDADKLKSGVAAEACDSGIVTSYKLLLPVERVAIALK